MVEHSKLMEDKPQYIVDIERDIAEVRSEKLVAMENQDFELAAKFRETEQELKEKLKPIKAQWEFDYLRNLTLQKAISRYGNPIPSEILKRIESELSTIKTIGYSESFLIVQDIIQVARNMGILVGPGRHYVASSIVAYCLKITDIDPVKYDLLFERFLDPNQIFGIEIDFDDEGPGKILHWITEKYGKEINSVNDWHVTLYDDTMIISFLGFETLSIIKKTLSNIKKSKEIDLDISKIPLDDAKTFELYSKGDTKGIFLFESHRMQQYLQALQPTKFEDLMALNALYHPGALDYIPDLIDRKQGRKEITYDFPEMESRLKETYGIYVYQEQIMHLSQDLAGFTSLQSNELRKAMWKKFKDKTETEELEDKMEILHEKFMEGATLNGFSQKEKLEKVWTDWTEFVKKYALDKSHVASYTLISYRTAYLKANFPEEFEDAYKHVMMNRDVEDKLFDLWIGYDYFSENLGKIIKRGFCYSNIQNQSAILVTGINPSFRVNDKGNREFSVSFDYQTKRHEKDRYFKSIDNLFVDEDKEKVSYIDIFNFKETAQKTISLFYKEPQNKGIKFLAENLAITQYQMETLIKPKLIIVKNKRSWDFWGLNAKPKQDNDWVNMWMGYKFDKVKEFPDTDVSCGRVRKITGLIDSEQRVSYEILKKTNLEGTIVLFTNHFQYCKKEQLPTPELIKKLYEMAINNK